MTKIKIKKVTEIHEFDFNGQKNFGTFEQLEELCLALEEYLYDEPTYDELNERVLDLEIKNEKLKDEYENLNATFEDKLDRAKCQSLGWF